MPQEVTTIYKWEEAQLDLATSSGSYANIGSVELRTDGRVVPRMVVPEPGQWLSPDHYSGRLSGSLESGLSFTDTEAFCTRVNHPPGAAELTFTTMGIDATSNISEFVRADVWLKNIRILGGAQAEINGFQVKLENKLKEPTAAPPSTLGGLLTFTREAGFTAADLEPTLYIVCKLLSIAQRTGVAAPFRLFYGRVAASPAAVSAFDNSWDYGTAHTLVAWDAATTLRFVEHTFTSFEAKMEDWDLGAITDYFWRMSVDDVLEAKYIFGSVLIEALKFAYACNVAKLQRDTKASGLIRGFVKSTRGNRKKHYNFQELLDMTFTQIGISSWDPSMIEDRNALFHTGRSTAAQTAPGGPTHPFLRPEFVKLARLIEEAILRLLGFTGDVYRQWELSSTPFP